MSGLTEIFKKPKMPELPAAASAPDMTDPTVKDAGRRRIAKEQARSGRESTNLTGTAPSYGSSDLGL